MIAYGLQTLLFTIGIIVHATTHWVESIEADIGASRVPGPATTVAEVFNDARVVYLDTTMVFSISVSIATMVFASTVDTRYELSFATVVPLIAMAPTLSAFAAAVQHKMKRWRLRLMLALITTALGVVAAVWAGWLGRMENHKFLDHNCDSPLFITRHLMGHMAIFPMSFLVCVCLMLSSVFLSWAFWKRRGRKAGMENVFKSRKLRAALTFVAFAYGWAGMALLIILRVGISRMAGKNYAENQWGFGQVVAVFVWAPVLLELAFGFSGKCCINPRRVDL
jgi:hypothetical protein